MQITVGQYVRVDLSPSERRKALVAVVNADGSADVMPLDEYGNSENPREIFSQTELCGVPTARMHPLLVWELHPLSSNVDMLRELAKELFRLQDWVGAVNLYREIIFRVRNNSVQLVRENGSVWVLREGRVVGKVDPNEGMYLRVDPAPIVGESKFPESMPRLSVGFPPHLHATCLLNIGRCWLQKGDVEAGIGELSNGIFVACLDDNEGVKRGLLGKLFFWRAKARLGLRRGAAAARDAATASRFCLGDPTTQQECELLARQATRVEEENIHSTRQLVKEIVKNVGN